MAALLFSLAVLAEVQSDASSARESSVPAVLILADERPGLCTFCYNFTSRHVGPVRFDHAAHMRVPGTRCADCHHEHRAHRMEWIPSCDNCHRRPDGVVVSNANMRCVACHSTPGLLRFSGKENIQRLDAGMSTKLHLNGEAFHQSCLSCHERSNIAGVNNWAPTACISCHQTKEQTNYEFIQD